MAFRVHQGTAHRIKAKLDNKLIESPHSIVRACVQTTKPSWMMNQCYKECTRPAAFDSLICCPGCKAKFTARMVAGGKRRPHLGFYVHCVEQCEEYKKLDLIKDCKPCKAKFLNFKSYSKHLQKHHVDLRTADCLIIRPKNTILADNLVSNQVDEHLPLNSYSTRSEFKPHYPRQSHSRLFDAEVKCKGCFKSFRTTLRHHHEAAYYTHCIEECDAYQKLGKIVAMILRLASGSLN